MPIIKSAKKRVRVATKAAIRNSKTKRSLKSAVKAFGVALEAKDKKKALSALDKVQSELDKAGKKGVLHPNKVARKKAQAARNAKKAAGVTKESPAKVAKPKVASKPKTATKKAPAKATPAKSTAKKPATTKKAPAKKPVAKKTTAAKKPATKK